MTSACSDGDDCTFFRAQLILSAAICVCDIMVNKNRSKCLLQGIHRAIYLSVYSDPSAVGIIGTFGGEKAFHYPNYSVVGAENCNCDWLESLAGFK